MSERGRMPGVQRLAVPLMLVVAAVSLVLVALSDGSRAESAARARAAKPVEGSSRGERIPAVTIGWVGDIVLGSRYGVPANGGRDLLASVRPLLRDVDVMIGNLEGAIGTSGAAKCVIGTPNCFAFQAPPIAANTLAWAGFDVVNLANNHAYDYGQIGLQETMSHLERAGVKHTGARKQITLMRQRRVTIAVLGFAAYPWSARLDDIPAAVELVKRARASAHVVVVTMHAGGEGTDEMHTPRGKEIAFGESRGKTRAFAHAVINAGADVVFGSGPHVIRGVERWRDALIIYSTGNFIGYNALPTTGELALSALTRVTINRHGLLLEGEWIPLRLIPPGQPRIDKRKRTSAEVAAELSVADFQQPGIRSNGHLITPSPPAS
ncbi:MAG: CapA family protein [Chloroflexota bacterium]|nr:CapA family protein [Chloroflexota bacterium]